QIEIRVEFDGPVEQAQRLVRALQMPLMKVSHPAKKKVVCVEAFRGLALGSLYFRLLQLGRNRAYHSGREAVLQIDKVFNGAVESIGPEMCSGGRINKLRSDANPIIGSTDAAFEHVAHAQFATVLLYIDRAALVRER